jgi:ABC-type multidrug transport system fused ATPase/permease subunit
MALANVLSANKEVLILDEITSSSDVISQDRINDVLNSLKGKKTIITIAHRFQILKHCNKIIYMDNAKIINIGSFKELSEKYDDFKKMVELSNFEI